MNPSAFTEIIKLSDRFGNAVELTVHSSLPERDAVMKEAEATALRLLEKVREGKNCTAITSNT